jgi:poly(A) polymerase
MNDLGFDKHPGFAVLKGLSDAGHQSFVVGGPVRNALMRLPIDDLDIATSAEPIVVMNWAKAHGFKVVPTGIDHGTVTVIVGHEGIEVTTFRRDVATDGRRAVVAFSDSIEEDARRRDFTMNALYVDAHGVLHDPLKGMSDLIARRVRFIDDPAQRIREDFLRILRFFRFFAWYGDPGLGIDADGLSACAELADGLETLSKERVGTELLKLLNASDPSQAVGSMEQSGVLMRVLPGASANLLPVLVHLESEHGFAVNPLRRMAALGGHDGATDLRFSKKKIRELHNMETGLLEMLTPKLAGYKFGEEAGRDIVLLQSAALEAPLDEAVFSDVDDGARSVLPLRASDLPWLSGPALGVALKQAEADWIASGFSLSKGALIAKSAK